jgi:hypothetical protein
MKTAIVREAKYLKRIVNIAGEMNPECKLYFAPGVFVIKTIDTTNAAFMKYEHYACECKEPFSARLLMKHLLVTIKRCDDESAIEFILDDHETKCEVRYDKPRSTQHTLPVIDEQEGRNNIDKEPSLPDTTTHSVMVTKEFYEAIQDASEIGKTIQFKIQKDAFLVTAKAEAGARTCTINVTREDKSGGKEAASRYNIMHLDNLFKASSLYKEVSLRISDDYPAELLFTDNNSKLRFVLAPIVDNN